MRIVHVITGLRVGGTEIMLAKLVARMDRGEFENVVVSLMDPGPVAERIRAVGITVHALGLRPGPAALWGVASLARLLRRERPQIVQTWLYHADLLGLFAARLARVPRVVWNLRCSNMDLRQYAASTALVVKLLARLSRLPDAVVVNSNAGQRWHEGLGYRPHRWEVIPNGFDLDRFRPDPDAPRRLRGELGLDAATVLVGHVARVDPMKDHAGFLAAAAIASVRPEVHFVLAGAGTETLVDEVMALGLSGRTHLLGERSNVLALMQGFDIHCLSSAFGEGFPNVIGEAMACGVPCVSTDVGDAAAIVGNCGLIVPPSDPQALSRALIDMVDRGAETRAELGRAARARIAAKYALPRVIERYQEIYGELLASGDRGAASGSRA